MSRSWVLFVIKAEYCGLSDEKKELYEIFVKKFKRTGKESIKLNYDEVILASYHLKKLGAILVYEYSDDKY